MAKSVFQVKVVASQAPTFQGLEKNKKGRPIMTAYETHFDKGDTLWVQSTAKFNSADSGDGVILADGGGQYYNIGPMLGSLFVRVEDVVKTNAAPPAADEPIYTVKDGDTLSGIALHFYKNGDFEHYNAIYKANKHILKSREDIVKGQKLVIPKL